MLFSFNYLQFGKKNSVVYSNYPHLAVIIQFLLIVSIGESLHINLKGRGRSTKADSAKTTALLSFYIAVKC